MKIKLNSIIKISVTIAILLFLFWKVEFNTVGFGETLTLQFKNNPKILARYFKKPLGIFKPGAYADVIVLDYDPLTPLNANTLGGHILFGLAGFRVRDTMINGRFVMKDRILLSMDHPKLMAQCREKAQALWSRL